MERTRVGQIKHLRGGGGGVRIFGALVFDTPRFKRMPRNFDSGFWGWRRLAGLDGRKRRGRRLLRHRCAKLWWWPTMSCIHRWRTRWSTTPRRSVPALNRLRVHGTETTEETLGNRNKRTAEKTRLTPLGRTLYQKQSHTIETCFATGKKRRMQSLMLGVLTLRNSKPTGPSTCN